jgi:hypothetical protein
VVGRARLARRVRAAGRRGGRGVAAYGCPAGVLSPPPRPPPGNGRDPGVGVPTGPVEAARRTAGELASRVGARCRGACRHASGSGLALVRGVLHARKARHAPGGCGRPGGCLVTNAVQVAGRGRGRSPSRGTGKTQPRHRARTSRTARDAAQGLRAGPAAERGRPVPTASRRHATGSGVGAGRGAPRRSRGRGVARAPGALPVRAATPARHRDRRTTGHVQQPDRDRVDPGLGQPTSHLRRPRDGLHRSTSTLTVHVTDRTSTR